MPIQLPAVVGVDPHADTLTAAAVDTAGALIWDLTVANTRNGITELVNRLNGHATLWAIEGTGTFGRALTDQLLATNQQVREVPTRLTARQRSRSGFTKTDKGDATAIARAALTDPLATVTHHQTTETLRILVRQREALVNHRTRALNRIRARLRELDPDTTRTLGRIRSKTALTRLATYPNPKTSNPYHHALTHTIRLDATNALTYTTQIRDLETRIRTELPEAGWALTTIDGIALIGAATIIASTGTITRFPTDGHYARYCGTAPLDASSGKTQRHRLNRWGNRTLNRVIHVAIITQLQHHKEAHHYLTRRTQQGKPRRDSIRAAERKLTRRIYQTLKHHPLT